MAIVIPLTKGYETVIDDIDSDLANYKWNAEQDGNTVYARRSTWVNKTPGVIRLHRQILGRALNRVLLPSEKIDHRDRNGLNNLRENLRLATHTQNICNQGIRANNKSGYKGVSFAKSQNAWFACIEHEGRTKSLGCYETPELAAQVYDKAARELFGEFAYLNFANGLK